jgi:hypothetical protein
MATLLTGDNSMAERTERDARTAKLGARTTIFAEELNDEAIKEVCLNSLSEPVARILKYKSAKAIRQKRV